MKDNIKICKNVKIGKNVKIEDNCIIGLPPLNKDDGELTTIIGDNSHIRSNTVIYAGNVIGSDFVTGHNVVIRELNEIGNNVSIGTGGCIEHHIVIEDGVRIHSQVFVPEYSLLKKEAWLGPNVVLTNAKYPRGKNVKDNLFGAEVGEKAKIGANSTILPGVKIGYNSLIGAGSVVTKNVDEYMVVAGNPAKIIGNIKDNPEYN